MKTRSRTLALKLCRKARKTQWILASRNVKQRKETSANKTKIINKKDEEIANFDVNMLRCIVKDQKLNKVHKM